MDSGGALKGSGAALQPTAAAKANAMRVFLVANAASGQKGAGHATDLLAAALELHGFEVLRHAPPPGGALDDAAAEAAAGAGPTDVVVALGGDGTVNTVAQALHARPFDARPALAILPLGTFNLVAKRYHLPDDAEALAELIAQRSTCLLGAGEVNGRWFFNNCSFGHYTSMIEARERHKARFGRLRIVAIASALVTLLTSRGRQAVRLDVQAPAPHARRLRTSLVFIGANPLQLAELGAALEQQVEAGALAFVGVRSTGWRELARFAWGALQANAAELQEVDALAFTAARITTRKRALRCVLDGELVHLPTPLALRFEPRALRLCAPPAAEVTARAAADTA